MAKHCMQAPAVAAAGAVPIPLPAFAMTLISAVPIAGPAQMRVARAQARSTAMSLAVQA